jgi:hypothetical protein
MSNGLIAYDLANDIHVVDPAGGDPRVLIGGDAMDMAPDWSPDGSRIAFWRRVPEAGVMVANADGSDPVLVIPGSMSDQNPPYFEWSPDGTQLLTGISDSDSTIRLVSVDGSGTRDLDVGMPVDFPVWHPDGRSILFRGWAEGDVTGLYTVDVETGGVTGMIVAADPGDPLFQRVGGESFYFGARFSPDGSRILYESTIDPLPGQDKDWPYRLRIVDPDGNYDHRVESSSTVRSEGWPAWSSDGTRFVAWVEPGTDRDLEYLAIVPVAADGAVVTTDPVAGGYDGWVWSPDGSRILRGARTTGRSSMRRPESRRRSRWTSAARQTGSPSRADLLASRPRPRTVGAAPSLSIRGPAPVC